MAGRKRLDDPATMQAAIGDLQPQQQAPTPLPQPKTGMSKGAMLTDILGQLADIGTTLPMVARPEFEEANPLGLPGVMAMKAGWLLAPLLAKKLHMPRGAADVMGYGIGAAGAVPAAMNLHTLKRKLDQ